MIATRAIVVAETTFEPQMRAYRLVRDRDTAACIALLAEHIGGGFSDGAGERFAQISLSANDLLSALGSPKYKAPPGLPRV